MARIVSATVVSGDGPAVAVDLRESKRIQRLKPTESDFVGRKGYKREYRADGSYAWTYDFRPNDFGKLTREAEEVKEMTSAFIRADTERHLRSQAAIPRVALRDHEGRTQFVSDRLADDTARRNGWGHHWRAGGIRVERGLHGGMLWRRISGQWLPTGKVQLGSPGKPCPKGEDQFDPDGVPWANMAGEWRRI